MHRWAYEKRERLVPSRGFKDRANWAAPQGELRY